MNQQDFLTEAIKEFTAAMDAFDRAENAQSERTAAAALRVSERRERTARTMAMLSLAVDVRRVADALEAAGVRDDLAESVRIFGNAS